MSDYTPQHASTGSFELTPSLIRTLVPMLAGLLGTWLVSLGTNIDSTVLAGFLTVVIGWVYYAVVRFLEVFSSDKWGYVLGIKAKPIYSPPAVVIGDTAAARGDAGQFDGSALGPVLIFLGLILLLIAVLVPFPLWPGIILIVAGVIMLLIGGPRTGSRL